MRLTIVTIAFCEPDPQPPVGFGYGDGSQARDLSFS